jgi:hypothetical protein
MARSPLPRLVKTIAFSLAGGWWMAFRIGAVRVAAAVSFATLLLVPIAAVARSGGLGFGARHGFVGSPLMQRYRAFNAVPYGGFVAGTLSSASYGESNIPPLQGREFPPDPPRILTCHRSQETMVVPVEGGGEQQIRITRC